MTLGCLLTKACLLTTLITVYCVFLAYTSLQKEWARWVQAGYKQASLGLEQEIVSLSNPLLQPGLVLSCLLGMEGLV